LKKENKNLNYTFDKARPNPFAKQVQQQAQLQPKKPAGSFKDRQQLKK